MAAFGHLSELTVESKPPNGNGTTEECQHSDLRPNMSPFLQSGEAEPAVDVHHTPNGVVSAAWASGLSVIQSTGTTMTSVIDEPSHMNGQSSSLHGMDLSKRSSREEAIKQGSQQRRSRNKQRGNTFLRFMFGIGPPTFGYPGSKLIHPNSWFSWMMTAIATMFLAFVAIVTPVIIGFFWDAEPCSEAPTLKIDIAVEIFFIFEIFVKFFTGIYHQGVYVDDWPFIVRHYLTGDFSFDVITSVPAGIVEYVSIQGCDPDGGAGDSSRELRMVRFLKGFRLIKMLRVLKTSSLVHAVQYLESIVKPPMVISRIFKLITSILLIVHFATCFYWLIKVEFRSSGPGGFDALELLKEDNHMPDSPSLGDKYIISMYFINTVFATVGFGDISAENNAERIYVVIIMYVGTLVFGAMLGEVQNIMDSLRKADRQRTVAVQETKDYLRAHQAPPEVERQMLSWVYFNEDVRIRDEQRSAVWSRFPDTLMYSLASHLHKDLLLKVGAFRAISEHKQSEGFLLDLFQSLESVTFCSDHAIGQAGHPADCLYYIVAGAVRVSVTDASGPHGLRETVLATLNPGDIFGEYSLFEDATWQTSMGTSATFWTVSHVHVKALSRERFLDVLALDDGARYDSDLEEMLLAHAAKDKAFRKRVGATKQTIPQMRWCQLLWKVISEVRTQMEKQGASAFFRMGKKMQFKTKTGRVLNKRKGSMRRSVHLLEDNTSRQGTPEKTTPQLQPIDSTTLIPEEEEPAGAGVAEAPAVRRMSSLPPPQAMVTEDKPPSRTGSMKRVGSAGSGLGLTARRGLAPSPIATTPFHGALIGQTHLDDTAPASIRTARAPSDDVQSAGGGVAGSRRSSGYGAENPDAIRLPAKRTVPAEKAGPKSYMRGMIAGSFKGTGRPSFSSLRSMSLRSMPSAEQQGDDSPCASAGGARGDATVVQEVVAAAEERIVRRMEGAMETLTEALMERMSGLEAMVQSTQLAGAEVI